MEESLRKQGFYELVSGQADVTKCHPNPIRVSSVKRCKVEADVPCGSDVANRVLC